MTVVEHVTEPPAPVAVPVYVVVVVGETEDEPPATGETEPMPLLIENVVALPVTHESEDVAPCGTAVGFAVSEQVGGGGATTVTMVEQVAVPPSPVTVPVYVVVELGVTAVEPFDTGETEPTEWSIEKLVPFTLVHEREAASPSVIDGLTAESVQTGGG